MPSKSESGVASSCGQLGPLSLALACRARRSREAAAEAAAAAAAEEAASMLLPPLPPLHPLPPAASVDMGVCAGRPEQSVVLAVAWTTWPRSAAA